MGCVPVHSTVEVPCGMCSTQAVSSSSHIPYCPPSCTDPRIGRHEVLPGVRRSARQRQEPLKWWLNEKKEFGRSHK